MDAGHYHEEAVRARADVLPQNDVRQVPRQARQDYQRLAVAIEKSHSAAPVTAQGR